MSLILALLPRIGSAVAGSGTSAVDHAVGAAMAAVDERVPGAGNIGLLDLDEAVALGADRGRVRYWYIRLGPKMSAP